MKDMDIHFKPAQIRLHGDIEDELIPLGLHMHPNQNAPLPLNPPAPAPFAIATQLDAIVAQLHTLSTQLERLIAITKRKEEGESII